MKIAYICTEKLPSPAIRGGAIQMMIDGVSPYISQEFDLTIFSISDPSLPKQSTQNNIHYMYFPQIEYEQNVIKALQSNAFDIIHVFNRPKNIPLYKQASPGSKFVLGLHNDMFAEHKISFLEGNLIIEMVTAIVTVSNYIRETVIERFPQAEHKISIVYSGVNIKTSPPIWTPNGQKIRNEFRKKYAIQDKKVILFVGRLTKNKGPDILIHSMKEVIKAHKDAVLVIVGGKWFSDNGVNKYIKKLHRLAKPIKEHVLFTKFIPADQIHNIFLMGDIFVCSSQWHEPLARVHYEAMAAGTPIITTNRGGNAEVITDEHNGCLIEQYNNPKEFSRLIQGLLSQPEFAKLMAQNGRQIVEKNFTFMHTANKLKQVYKQVTIPTHQPVKNLMRPLKIQII
ncbi:glycosyltransferase family 4 protein [Bacillus mycoides]|uniref:glycosyltransferase family 4 protein n=1 Tax=Bacillus mycoides TaxID=1405 RepID=UPI00077ABAB2|nr:glycosyltransferase family 4 protein [Bacillus mycoides]KXY37281.1 glycosyl transferase [Bacillus cereus]QEL85532.1 glycosyltransferase family 1 protein [Bacillus mycoides]QWH01321.1 glycosyltransferase family 1 protein [Bacillus mycoides]